MSVGVGVCVWEGGACINMRVSLCLHMCSSEHKYTPNQFKLGHLFTQSNVP